MADLTRTEKNARPLEVIEARLLPTIADEAIERGQVIYRKSNGRVGLARANAVATSRVLGFASSSVAAGSPVEAEMWGGMAGWDLSGVNPGLPVYLSAATAGAIADTAPTGTGNVVVALGTVQILTDIPGTRYIFIDVPYNAAPVALA